MGLDSNSFEKGWVFGYNEGEYLKSAPDISEFFQRGNSIFDREKALQEMGARDKKSLGFFGRIGAAISTLFGSSFEYSTPTKTYVISKDAVRSWFGRRFNMFPDSDKTPAIVENLSIDFIANAIEKVKSIKERHANPPEWYPRSLFKSLITAVDKQAVDVVYSLDRQILDKMMVVASGDREKGIHFFQNGMPYVLSTPKFAKQFLEHILRDYSTNLRKESDKSDLSDQEVAIDMSKKLADLTKSYAKDTLQVQALEMFNKIMKIAYTDVETVLREPHKKH